MEITISLKDAGLLIIGVGLILLIGYCVAFMRGLVITVKNTNKILEDAQVISNIAAEKSKEIDRMVDDVTSSVGKFSEAVKGNQNIVSALTSVVNATASLRNLIKKLEKGSAGKTAKKADGKINKKIEKE